MNRPLRVCWFGTWREEYSRNRIMIEGLRSSGVEVVECHVPLWGSIDDRVRLVGGRWSKVVFLFRAIGAGLRLVGRSFFTGRWDVLMLGYPGPFDAYLARPLAWLRRKPLVLDAFMSPWLIAWERGLVQRSPLTGRFLHAAEKGGLKLADLIVQDTEEYAAWTTREFGIPRDRIRLVPTGADSARFSPRPGPAAKDGLFRVLYAGTFIPNHGVPTIIRAAEQLKDDPAIRFVFIGDGPDKAAAEVYAKEKELRNVSFEPWVPGEALPARLAEADVCLGAFGTTPQSLMTIQNKIYEGLAMAKPVLTGDSPAVRAVLAHGQQVWLCPRENSAALAEAVLALKADPALRERLGKNGRSRFLEIGSLEAVGAALRRHLEERVGR